MSMRQSRNSVRRTVRPTKQTRLSHQRCSLASHASISSMPALVMTQNPIHSLQSCRIRYNPYARAPPDRTLPPDQTEDFYSIQPLYICMYARKSSIIQDKARKFWVKQGAHSLLTTGVR